MFRRARRHRVWRNLQDRPFATAVGGLLLASSLITLTGTSITRDALFALVPTWLFYALAIAYGLAGLLLLVGQATNRLNLEAAGCMLALSGIVVRGAALVMLFGVTIDILANLLFYLFFGGACVERLLQCLNGEHIVRVSKVVTIAEVKE